MSLLFLPHPTRTHTNHQAKHTHAPTQQRTGNHSESSLFTMLDCFHYLGFEDAEVMFILAVLAQCPCIIEPSITWCTIQLCRLFVFCNNINNERNSNHIPTDGAELDITLSERKQRMSFAWVGLVKVCILKSLKSHAKCIWKPSLIVFWDIYILKSSCSLKSTTHAFAMS